MPCDFHSDNLDMCNCTAECPRKGNCCLCLAHHRAKNQLPACYFTEEEERTWNRSIKFFVQNRAH